VVEVRRLEEGVAVEQLVANLVGSPEYFQPV
jgi:hypothetical protein